eukprot:TRINITY_DN1260_c0_g3_i2.p1 TRINITY_DN1260_c0_g3~~TRINITY_DN1260_c0_g3_i2.p1  ORF type:complete len:645 (+),score=77.85 TRINITY_DN1260_c0_g3_i2:109-2043(+)
MVLRCVPTLLRLALLCSLYSHTVAGKEEECAEVLDSTYWRYIVNSCKPVPDKEFFHPYYQRNAHFYQYTTESITLPALAALGPKAKDVLILGGSDAGVLSQVLKSSDVVKVTVVTTEVKMLKKVEHTVPFADEATKDRRVQIVEKDPLKWLNNAHKRGPDHSFDLIIAHFEFDARWTSLSPLALKDSHFKHMSKLLRTGGLVVYDVAQLWRSDFIADAYRRMSQFFPNIWFLQHSAPDKECERGWHQISFVAGDSESNVLNMDTDWWAKQKINTMLYSKSMHTALLTPSTTLSKVLGLHIPKKPDLALASKLDPSKTPGIRATKASSCWNQFVREKHIMKNKTMFQWLHVYQKGECMLLELDEELQLTSEFGDFYHEALVHPIMAALGKRGKRVLIIGAGDGGVASNVLHYPDVEVTQVEIDIGVIEASYKYLPYAHAFKHPRLKLLIADAVQWVFNMSNSSTDIGTFDLVVMDTTDNPLASPWSLKFFRALKTLLAPHGAIIQNIGSQEVVEDFRKLHVQVFPKLNLINCNNPDYPSPYLLAVMTEGLNLETVDWEWWSSLNIPTMYYHPTMHSALLAVPKESQDVYIDGHEWEAHDLDFIEAWIDGDETEQKKKKRKKTRSASGLKLEKRNQMWKQARAMEL